ncbi:uncharacterized protein MONOS_11999 [Monocercomonoides exilis]|uniref:uncharacterized protein n=1 Tax=Monocercomonoides exilis TaxID=2049356 RepID=UPI00355A8DF0|nr:hypothetical protein MONOS_11999 [Monocercomonoides exilis]|eukprot:MONOS_11999.1-p1 / transcript=MONOS_11999.1 / gene=MONOS_11999 / organism=Monocercomonoides_exilis_PA203 / gene_product=unspecified product / transcript_product=unspecified product / location=Mono_scaffold00634:35918-37348(+) / protein_length=358 / sequence_SO=supercontig / SO=protein_coding / is_pseudo=false
MVIFHSWAAQQSSLRSAPLSSSTGAARRSTSPFRRRRSEEKKSSENEQPSSAPAIDPSDASAVATSYTSAGAMDDIDRRLGSMLLVSLVVPLPSHAVSVGTKSGIKRIFAAPDVNAFPSIYDLFDTSLKIWRSQQSRHCAGCAGGAGRREEGERGGKEGEEKGEEKGEEDGGREEGDVNEVKGGYPTAHREFVERIKENQGKLEEAMAPLVVEALGLSGLRFVKADAEVGASKQHPMKPEVCSSSPSDGIQQEISRAAEEEAADGSLGLASDGSAEEVGKDVEQVEMSANGLGMNEKQDKEGDLIDLEEEEEEETDNKGLRKDTHRKAFPYPQKPKIRIHQEQLKNMTGDELCDAFG